MSTISKIAQQFEQKLSQLHAPEPNLAAKVTEKLSQALGADMSHRIKFLDFKVTEGKVFFKFAIEPKVKQHPQFPKVVHMASGGKDLPNFLLDLAKEVTGAADGQGVEVPWV